MAHVSAAPGPGGADASPSSPAINRRARGGHRRIPVYTRRRMSLAIFMPHRRGNLQTAVARSAGSPRGGAIDHRQMARPGRTPGAPAAHCARRSASPRHALAARLAGQSFMALLIVALLAIFALNVLPAATITLTPGQEGIATTVQITADPALPAADIEARAVPGRLIEVTLEKTGVIATTGSQQKPVDNAVGAIVFTNLGPAPVEIPSGAVVSTSTGTPVNFRTTQSASLEGGIGARVTVPIEALEPGVAGNVRANTINTVRTLRFSVRVSNPGATYGGGSNLVRARHATGQGQPARPGSGRGRSRSLCGVASRTGTRRVAAPGIAANLHHRPGLRQI